MNSLKSGSLIETDDVTITGIRVTEENKGGTSDTDVVYQYGEDGYVLEITGNQLIQEGERVPGSRISGKKIKWAKFSPYECYLSK